MEAPIGDRNKIVGGRQDQGVQGFYNEYSRSGKKDERD